MFSTKNGIATYHRQEWEGEINGQNLFDYSSGRAFPGPFFLIVEMLFSRKDFNASWNGRGWVPGRNALYSWMILDPPGGDHIGKELYICRCICISITSF